MVEHPYENYHLKVQPALLSKAEELSLLGLGAVTEDDIWNYLVQKKWKRIKPEMHLHQLVSDILSISGSQFMTFVTVEAFKGPNLLGKISEEEMKELLNS
ncbi:post-transcriptional regulator [Bacillus sp. V5-8f]|uniref:post-transcriptional regulator n=1 Tax=Bacillus sp. V5-8f TaxID=2053044 RepID=UPI000C787263|nr:post-transcriptional regulator [Bacillus sp. V5-8f]PLT34581.1 post-transcriptional regulator [Bacillus sp. V5-8f]